MGGDLPQRTPTTRSGQARDLPREPRGRRRVEPAWSGPRTTGATEVTGRPAAAVLDPPAPAERGSPARGAEGRPLQPGRTTRVRRTTQALAHRGCPGHRHHVRRVLASPWPERSRALARRRLGGAVRSRRHRGGLAHVVHGTRLRLHRSHGPRAQPRDHDLGSDAFVRGRRRRHPRRVRAGPLFPFRPPGRAPRRRRARHSAAVRRLLHPGEGVRARHPAVVRCAGGGGAGPASAG